MKIKIQTHPLSVNKVWQGRRFKTKCYKDYEEELLYKIKGKKVEGFVEIDYKFYIKYFKTSDVGNFEKPLSDIIVKAGLIDDDRFIKKITMEKFKSDEEYIEIIINKFK